MIDNKARRREGYLITRFDVDGESFLLEIFECEFHGEDGRWVVCGRWEMETELRDVKRVSDCEKGTW